MKLTELLVSSAPGAGQNETIEQMQISSAKEEKSIFEFAVRGAEKLKLDPRFHRIYRFKITMIDH